MHTQTSAAILLCSTTLALLWMKYSVGLQQQD